MPFDKYTPKQKRFAALAEPRDKITQADRIAGATGKANGMMQKKKKKKMLRVNKNG